MIMGWGRRADGCYYSRQWAEEICENELRMNKFLYACTHVPNPFFLITVRIRTRFIGKFSDIRDVPWFLVHTIKQLKDKGLIRNMHSSLQLEAKRHLLEL